MSTTSSASRGQRVELILQGLETLPTLSPIALRLLRLSSADDSDLREIVSLVEADAALTGRLLSMCRRAQTGLGDSITTVDRAIVMLGYEAVRSALLSVHLHDMISGGRARAQEEPDFEAEQEPGDLRPIDRAGLWRHGLAVACAAEMIAQEHRSLLPSVPPDEAFVCGLLHDLGKHALDAILPRTYARAARTAERRGRDIAEIERSLIGVDHHAAGKRLAEQWGFPSALVDVIWLHNQPADNVPDLPHKPLIGIVTVADCLARCIHLGWSGNCSPVPSIRALCAEWGLDQSRLDGVLPRLIDLVARRTRDLGLEDAPDDTRLALDSVLAANRSLARLNASLHERARLAEHQARSLSAIVAFHADPSGAGRGLVGAFAAVVRSAAEVFGDGFYAMIYQACAGQIWHVCQCTADGRVIRSQAVAPPAGGNDLAALADPGQLSAANLGMVSWLTEHLTDAQNLRRVHLLPLIAGDGRPALLVHDRRIEAVMLRSPALRGLTATWAAAVAAAAQHEGARRLGEQLVEANRRITQTQRQLAELESISRLAELAAGLAHEMNNPLTVISGRSQILAGRLDDAEDSQTAKSIVEAAAGLSDLITSLHYFAKPPESRPAATDLPDLLSRIVRDFKQRRTEENAGTTPVKLFVQGPLPPVWVDASHLSAIVTELLQNAWESGPRGFIELRAHIDPADDRLIIVVKDDGRGMSEHALRHAFDPFFSEKPAGRQRGLGLAKARRLADVLSGRIELESQPGKGTAASLVLDQWRRRPGADESRHAA